VKRESYAVQHVPTSVPIDGQWESAAWNNVPALAISRPMGDRPSHHPDTRAKLLLAPDALQVIFHVEDRYVRSVHGHQEAVCRDSCVEFFFVPGTDLAEGYFNLETNCGGHMLFRHQHVPRGPATEIAREDCDRIILHHSMPSTVEPEVPGPVVWTLHYRLPLDILARYAPVTRPAPGVRWRANFYKCADRTSHPHWLTWSEVHRPQPDFHVPEDFGELVFV
jgi:hypothetical protein